MVGDYPISTWRKIKQLADVAMWYPGPFTPWITPCQLFPAPGTWKLLHVSIGEGVIYVAE